MHTPPARGAILLEAALLLALAGTIVGLSQLQHAVAQKESEKQLASSALAVETSASTNQGSTSGKEEQICGQGNGEQMKGYKYTHTVRYDKIWKKVRIDRTSEPQGTSIAAKNTLSTCTIKYCPVEGDNSACITLKKVTAGEAYQDPENIDDVVTQTAASTDDKTEFEQVKKSLGVSDQQVSEMLNAESGDLDAQIAAEQNHQSNIQKQLDNLRGVTPNNENITQQERLQNELSLTKRNIAEMQQQNANLKSNMSSLAASPLNPYNSPRESGPGPGVGAGGSSGQQINPTQSINETAQNSWATQAGQNIAQTPPLAGSYSGQGGGANTPAENGPGPGMGGGGSTANPPQTTVTPVYGPAQGGGGGSIMQGLGSIFGGLLGGMMGGGGGGGGGSGNTANPCAQWPGTALSQSSQRCECSSGKTWNGSACATIDTGGEASTVLSAELSCAPAIQEIGKPISLSWTCRNANTSGTASVGDGFNTNGAASGTISDMTATSTATTTLSSMHFGLTCKKGSETKQASCELQTVRPFLVLVAVPSSVVSGATANIAWVTGGMRNTNDACALRSSGDATFMKQGVNGVAESHTIATSTIFTMRCTSAAGYSHETSVTVTLK